MSKQETALSEKQILKLLGKPTPDTQYPKTQNPAVIKLLKQYNNDATKVYKFYDVLCTLGWITGQDFEAYKSNVRKTKQKVTGPALEEAKDLELKVKAATEGEVEHLRHIIADQNKEIKRLRLDSFNNDSIVSSLAEAIDSVTPDRFSLNLKPITKTQRDKKFYSILPISDAHFGEVVIPEQINNVNAYNMEISKRRHIKLFEDNYEFAKNFGCEDLHIFLLGDLFSGNIHGELRESNEAPVTECLIEYYKFLTGLINEYSKLFKTITISCVVGNHARTTDKYQFKNKGKDNYEYILYGFLEHYYQTGSIKNVTVRKSDSTILFTKVGQQTWKLEHGDRYKGGGAFVSPFSTVVRDNFKDKSIFCEDGQQFDAVIMGHWHIAGEMYLQGSNIPVYLNASIVGPGEYSIHNLHSAFPAQSNIFVTDGNRVISKSTVELGEIR